MVKLTYTSPVRGIVMLRHMHDSLRGQENRIMALPERWDATRDAQRHRPHLARGARDTIEARFRRSAVMYACRGMGKVYWDAGNSPSDN